MELGTILAIGSFGLSLFAHNRARNAYREQENEYRRQAELNRRIGNFNAEIAERAGTAATSAIIEQTKKTMGQQIVEFSNRGVELDGSPMLVLGETATMGMAEAQNAYFNAQVNKINYQFAAEGATATAMANAQNAHYGALSQTIQTVQTLKDGYNLVKSMFKTPQESGVGANSTLGSIVGSMLK